MTSGYGNFCWVQRIGPDSLTHTRPLSSMRNTALKAGWSDAAGGRNAGEVIEHDRVRQRQELVGVIDDVGIMRIELHMPAVVRRARRDLAR